MRLPTWMPRSRRSFARYFSLGLALFGGLVTTGAKQSIYQRPRRKWRRRCFRKEVLQKLELRATWTRNGRILKPLKP